MEDQDLLSLTVDVVSAHISNNALAAEALPGFIQSVYGALAQLGQAAPVEEAAPQPAVSIRSSVKPDAVSCLECGKAYKMLKRHLGTDHDLTPAAYRARWGLKADYPLTAPNYAARRKELAVQIGLGRKPGGGRKAAAGAKPAPAAKPRGRKAKVAAPAEG